METEGSLRYSHEPCTEPDESHPHPPYPVSLRPILILLSHPCHGLPCGLFPLVFLPKSSTHSPFTEDRHVLKFASVHNIVPYMEFYRRGLDS
jgi:hypothetical protein